MAGESKKAIYAAIIGNFLISITKFVAAGITGSSAMLAEGVHSLVDTGNGGLLVLGIHRSKRPPDDEYPYGYGKEVYFWTLVVAMTIFALGGGVSLYEGIKHIQHPGHLEDPTVNYVVLALALVFEGFAWVVAFREFNKLRGQSSMWAAIRGSKDPTTFAILFEDSAALLGLIVAFVGIYLGHFFNEPRLDGVASAVIGLLLIGTAFVLARETKGLLMGESALSEVVQSIHRIVEGHSLVDQSLPPLTMHMGPNDILVNLSVRFRRGLKSSELELAIDELEDAVKAKHPHVKRIYIEADALGQRARAEMEGAPPPEPI